MLVVKATTKTIFRVATIKMNSLWVFKLIMIFDLDRIIRVEVHKVRVVKEILVRSRREKALIRE